MAELDGAGNVVSLFNAGFMRQGGNAYRILTDHLGSPRLVVNAATGAVVERRDYDEYGRLTYSTTNGDIQDYRIYPLGFAGGIEDRDTGLVRFGARDYDPEIGRFTTKDPIRFAGGMNFYGYALGDPINLADPLGLGPVNYWKDVYDNLNWDAGLDALQLALGVLGLVPVLGEGADLVDALISALRGDMVGAGVGLAAAIPIVGGAARAGGLANTARKAANAADALHDAGNVGDAAKRMTPDQQSLKEIVDEATRGGRNQLSKGDAETIMDWADEVNYPGARANPGDVSDPSNWAGRP